MPIEFGGKEVLGGVTVIGIVVGWITSGIRISKFEGRKEERLDTVEKVVEKHDGEIRAIKEKHDTDLRDVKNHHDDGIREIKNHHDIDMAAIRAFFSTPSGGQKFITFPDHDAICLRNGKSTSQEIAHLTDAIKENTSQVSVLSENVMSLKVSVAVLQDDKNRRAGDGL